VAAADGGGVIWFLPLGVAAGCGAGLLVRQTCQFRRPKLAWVAIDYLLIVAFYVAAVAFLAWLHRRLEIIPTYMCYIACESDSSETGDVCARPEVPRTWTVDNLWLQFLWIQPLSLAFTQTTSSPAFNALRFAAEHHYQAGRPRLFQLVLVPVLLSVALTLALREPDISCHPDARRHVVLVPYGAPESADPG
jgi:hypothetical protein